MCGKQRVVLIEDEALARGRLKHMLQARHRDLEVVGEAETTGEGWRLVERGGVDGVFLDIHFQTESGWAGMDLAWNIKHLANPPWIVFTTAHAEFAVEAFGVRADGYLVKPFGDDALARALEGVAPRPPVLPRIEIRHRAGGRWAVNFVDPAGEILYLSKINNSDALRVHLLGCRDLLDVQGSLQSWQERLAPYGIEQIHKSCLANRAFFDGLRPDPVIEEGRRLLLKGGCPDALRVGRKFLGQGG